MLTLAAGINGVGLIEILLVCLMGALVLWPCWRICTKAGLPGALSLIGFVPAGVLILLFIWAFKDWPGQEDLK